MANSLNQANWPASAGSLEIVAAAVVGLLLVGLSVGAVWLIVRLKQRQQGAVDREIDAFVSAVATGDMRAAEAAAESVFRVGSAPVPSHGTGARRRASDPTTRLSE